MFKKRGFLAIALVLCMAIFAAPAMADVLYTAATDGGWTTDRLGLISGANVPTKDILTNLGGTSGSGVFSFYNAAGGSRVAVAQYTGSATDTIWLYNSVRMDWKTPIEIGNTANPVKNIHHMAANGKYLYAAGYDEATIGMFDTTDDKYTAGKTTYKYTPEDSSYTAHAERLAYYNDNVYALFTESKGSYPSYTYNPHTLVKLDKNTLAEVSKVVLNGKNMDGATVGSSFQRDKFLYVASTGGNQTTSGNFNTDSMIEKVDLEAMTSTILVKTSDVASNDSTWAYDFKALTVAGDKVYIMAGNWSGTDNVVIYETTQAKLDAGDIGTKIKTISTGMGYSIGMEYDAVTKLLWASVGNSMYKYDGSVWTEYNTSALGGNIAKFAALLPAKKGTIDFTSKDISVKDDKGNVVSIDAITVSNVTSDFKAADVSGDYTVTPMSKIVISLDSTPLSDEQAVTFTITNCTLEMGEGDLKVYLKAKGEEKYSAFDANYDKTKKELTFTVTNAKKYFSENTLYIASAVKNSTPTPTPTPSGGSGGGCSAGFAGLALLAFAPLALRSRKKK